MSLSLQNLPSLDAIRVEMARRGLDVSLAELPPIPPIYQTVWDSKRPYQIWYGGRGGGKSWTKAIYFLFKAQRRNYFRLVFARDTQKNVRKSQYQLFKDIAAKFECFHGRFEFIDTRMEIICKANNNVMFGGSFEQPDTLRSVADPTDFWAEEPITRESQIARDSFLDIVGSLRNSYNQQTQFHFTFNPISKETWIYDDFFERDLYDAEKLFVNYFDNPFCPQTTIDFLESLKRIDPKRYEVDALGNWGTPRDGLIFPDYEAVDGMPPPQAYGLDFGYTDATALVALAARDVYGEEKKDLFVSELLYESRLTSKDLIHRFERLGVLKNVKIVADNARPEMIKDLQDAGYHVEPCVKYKGSPADDINRILNYNLKIVRGSKNYFDEIKNYVWDEKNGKLIDVPASGVDHLMDATRYGSQFFSESVYIPIDDAPSYSYRGC